MKKILVMVFISIFLINVSLMASELDGAKWQASKQDFKSNYIKGFIEGANSSSEFLPKECTYSKAKFTKHDAAYYLIKTGEFYKKYPEYKKISVPKVLIQMCDFLDMNIDEIARTFY